MTTLLLPEDVEQAFIDELSPYYSIGSSLPETIPAVFLRITAAGGFQRDLVTDTFTVTLESFAKLEAQASLALSTAIARVQHAQQTTGKLGNAVCYRIQVAGVPQNLPFPSVPTHKRYVSTLAPDLRRLSLTL